MSTEVARQSSADVFLGVAFTSGLEEVVVPMFDPGLPTEYELTRSIRVVSKSGRKKVGILATDAKMLGGFDFRSMGQETEWPFRHPSLKKQYDVSSVALDAPDPRQPRRPPGRPALVDDPGADRRPHRPRPPGASRRSCSTTPCRCSTRRSPPTSPRRPPGGPFGGGQLRLSRRGACKALLDPPRDRLAGQRDRLEPVQPAA